MGFLYKPAKVGQGVLVEVGGLTVEAHLSPEAIANSVPGRG